MPSSDVIPAPKMGETSPSPAPGVAVWNPACEKSEETSFPLNLTRHLLKEGAVAHLIGDDLGVGGGEI